MAHGLTAQGALPRQYFGIGHLSLRNYVALIGGQAPNPATQADGGVFSEFVPTLAALDSDGQMRGAGCVYPPSVHTIADQLEAARLPWKGYMEDMGDDPAREAATCDHAVIGMQDATNRATPNDQYADKHNPFVYFHANIDNQPRCERHVVNLAALAHDLRSTATTTNYAFIAPNLCHDGHELRARTASRADWFQRMHFCASWCRKS